MHKTMTLKVHLNKLSDGTDPALIVNKVHGVLQEHLAPHGFVGVQVMDPEPFAEPEAPGIEPAPEEAPEAEKPKKKSK